jgi:hypothetical protein
MGSDILGPKLVRSVQISDIFIHFFSFEVQNETRNNYVRGLRTPLKPFTTLPSGLHSTEINNISNKCHMHSLTIQIILDQNYRFQIIRT